MSLPDEEHVHKMYEHIKDMTVAELMEVMGGHLHWLTKGGEFSHWLATENVMMSQAALREYEEASDFWNAYCKLKRIRGS